METNPLIDDDTYEGIMFHLRNNYVQGHIVLDVYRVPDRPDLWIVHAMATELDLYFRWDNIRCEIPRGIGM